MTRQLGTFGILFVFTWMTGAAFAADETAEPTQKKNEISEILNSMGYPELQVVPRASDRLAIEAKSETSSWMLSHWTIELSGLVTAGVGLTSAGARRTDLSSKQITDTNTISAITIAVGSGWFLGGALLGADKPYRSGLNTLSKYPGKDERSTLMRERMAEEALERPAKTMQVLKYFAVATNFTMNALSALSANTGGKVTCGVGAVLSFLPLMFEDHSIEVYEKQIEYKKKIYTPIQSASFYYEPYNKTLTPMTNLKWTF